MIIGEKNNDFEIVGEDTSKKAKISSDKMAKLQYLLTKGLYRDPITAVIAEWCNNGVDSVVQAGKSPIEYPVIAQIGKDSNNQYIFSVEDKGVGLDNRDFEDICMNYLESTKEGDNDTIGHFGIGMKSFLALERSATFICRKNGVERKYLVYEGDEFVNYDLLYEKPTDQENGVIAELIISNWSERDSFITKAKQKLAYYDTVMLIIDKVPVTNNIYREELFQWSTLNKQSVVHISLKDVYYAIDWEALGVTQISLPIALRFNLDSGLTPTPSRESYITNEKTKQLILKRLEEVADWFIDKYNEGVIEYDKFLDGFDKYDTTNYYVTLGQGLESKQFLVNSIEKYGIKKIKQYSLKGLTFRDANFYKGLYNRYQNFFKGYIMDGYFNFKFTYNIRGISFRNYILNKKFPIVVGPDFVGNLREFIKKKHGRDIFFIRKTSPVKLRVRIGYSSGDDYYNILGLRYIRKDKWRDHIKEFQFVENQMIENFHDETDCANSPEFAQFLADKKAEQTRKRKEGYIGPNSLNKALGDITLAYDSIHHRKVSFKKKAFPKLQLLQHKFLTVVLTKDDDLELAKKFKLTLGNTIRFALVGPQEMKKLPKFYQFINFQQFMSRDCKPFMRLASSILFERVLDEYEEINNYASGIFANCIKEFDQDVKKLEEYNKQIPHSPDDTLADIILAVAEEKDLFDKRLWAEYLHLKNGIKKYDWISCFTEPDKWNNDEVKRYNKIITQVLLFRKKYYNEFPDNAEIIFKEPEPIDVELPKEEDTEEEEGEFNEIEPEIGDFDDEFVEQVQDELEELLIV